jgi:hypothetical protein
MARFMATGCHRRAERGGIQSASGSALTGGHFMKFKLPSILVGAALGVLALTRPAAHAAPASSVFDQDYCSTSCLNGALGGTVTLSQTDADNVLVTVDLTGVYFHSTKDSFAFDLDLTGATINSISDSTDFAAVLNTTVGEDGAGNFNYAVDCSKCGPAHNDTQGITSVSFTVSDSSGISLSDFQTSSGGTGVNYFAASVYNASNTSCTGEIGADGMSSSSSTATGTTCSMSAVPAPLLGHSLPTVLAVGGLLFGVRLWDRRRKVLLGAANA